MHDSKGAAEDELEDLQGGQGLFEPLRKSDLETGEGEVEVHQGVDEGVEDDEDPDGRGHVSDAGPHAEDGAGVVVALEEGGGSSLEQDNDGVEDLVVLGQVEEVGVEGQTFQVEVLVVGPEVVVVVVVVADALPEELCSGQGAGLDVLEEQREDLGGDLVDGPGHADEGPDGVDAEQDVMEQDERLEALQGGYSVRCRLELFQVFRQRCALRVRCLEELDLAVEQDLVEVVDAEEVRGGDEHGDEPVQGDRVDDCLQEPAREGEGPCRDRLGEVGDAEGVDVGEELPLDQGVDEGRLGAVSAGHGVGAGAGAGADYRVRQQTGHGAVRSRKEKRSTHRREKKTKTEPDTDRPLGGLLPAPRSVSGWIC